ncbi:TetR/AcrR family transcriptional regulator [Methylopila musalis]|uniref:TetR/AcrR family transcriptional regulator n=1 Tax=Methylopila musalis TaxID=1134781 RepID=A0ABW3Z323_9HYPH
MSDAHRRRKLPAEVRAQVLDVAAALCVERGLSAMTLEAVARRAGVSKGGLLHHFPSKQALLEGLSDELLADFDRRIDAFAAEDPEPRGRFARAYLLASVAFEGEPCGWNGLAALMMGDASLRVRWTDWMEARLARPDAAEATAELAIVRFAADGLWLSDLMGASAALRPRRAALIDALLALTRVEGAGQDAGS